MTYNGYATYETWAVALWMDNEKPHPLIELLDNIPSEAYAQAQDTITSHFQKAIDETDVMKNLDVWSDLLQYAFDTVNWYELAKDYLDERDRDRGYRTDEDEDEDENENEDEQEESESEETPSWNRR